jgi:thiamine phosphate synthase YjbQ (UPF0047 family)
VVAQGAAYRCNGLCSQWYERYMMKRVLTLVNAQHIAASVFINDDESGLHHDYEVWLERLAPHAPVDQCRPQAGCTTAPARTMPTRT